MNGRTLPCAYRTDNRQARFRRRFDTACELALVALGIGLLAQMLLGTGGW